MVVALPLAQAVHQKLAIIRLVPVAVLGIAMAVQAVVIHLPLATAETMSVAARKLTRVVR